MTQDLQSKLLSETSETRRKAITSEKLLGESKSCLRFHSMSIHQRLPWAGAAQRKLHLSCLPVSPLHTFPSTCPTPTPPAQIPTGPESGRRCRSQHWASATRPALAAGVHVKYVQQTFDRVGHRKTARAQHELLLEKEAGALTCLYHANLRRMHKYSFCSLL